MDLDSFIISILFDNKKTESSAKKIEDTVTNLKNKILSSFAAIASVDFLKNAVEGSIKLATKLDNLSYVTNISKENLTAWGEAVKRNGGTAEGFYTSISSLSEKIRDMQTSFGSAGQLVFARLGIHIKDANGHVKTAVDVLGQLGDKFKSLPKVWQQNLGQQLGLDPATIRLLSNGNEAALKLVQNMAKYAQINNLNIENNIKLRNTFYDVSLVFESIKLKLANELIPIMQKFSEILFKGLRFLQEHFAIVRIGIILISALMSGVLLSAIASVTRAIAGMTLALLRNPFVLMTAAIAAFVLVLDDFFGYLESKNSALEKFYKTLSATWVVKGLKLITAAVKEFAGALEYLNKIGSHLFGSQSFKEFTDSYFKNEGQTKPKESISDKIKNAAISMGINPDFALKVAQRESNLNPNAENDKSSASGLFQLTDDTALSNGITDLSKKNNVDDNIRAGILNLKKITDGLSRYFHRDPTAGEVSIGEMLGLAGSKKLFSSNKNTMLSNLVSGEVLKANPQFKTMTSGQLINNANKTFEQKSVTIGEVKINAPNSNARDISKKISLELQKQLTGLVTNVDNGILA